MPFRFAVDLASARRHRIVWICLISLSWSVLAVADDPPAADSAPAVAKPAEALAGELVHVRPKQSGKNSKNLLNAIDTAKHVVYTAPEDPVPVEEQFQFVEGVLRMPAKGDARLCLPVAVPNFYHLVLKLKSTAPKENRPVGIGIVLAGRECLVQSKAEWFGLDDFLGQSLSGKRQILPNHWFGFYTTGPEGIVELLVGDTGFLLHHDGKYFEWFGTPEELSLGPKWAVPETDKLFLTAPAGDFDVLSIELDPLTRDDWIKEVSTLLPNGRIAWADFITKERKISPTIDALPEPDSLRPTIRLLGYRGDFDELEQWAERFRQDAALIGNRFASEALYEWLSQLYLVSNDGGVGSWPELWQMQFAFVDAWLKERPDSVTARVVKARSLIQYAWDARHRPKDDVRAQDVLAWKAKAQDPTNKKFQEREQLFHERMEEAERILNDAAPLKPRDVAVFSALLAVGNGQRWDREKMEVKLERGLQITKRDDRLYVGMVDYVLADEHRDRGELAKIAQRMAARCDRDDGLDVYARIAMECHFKGIGIGEFAEEKLKAAVPVWIERYPHHSFMMNFACWLCCQLEDADAAKDLFDHHVRVPEFKVWGNRDEFDRRHRWCDPSIPEAPRFLAVKRDEVSLQAQAGGLAHVAFLPDNQTLAAGSELSGATVRFWDLRQESFVDKFELPKLHWTIQEIRFLASGDLYALVSDGEKKFGMYYKAPENTTAYIPAIPELMYTSDDFKTWVLIKEGKATVDHKQPRGERQVFAVPEMSKTLLSPDGSVLLGVDDKLHLWDTAAGKEVSTLDVKPLAVAFPDDSSGIAYATEDKLTVWDIAGRRERFAAPLEQCTVRAIASARRGHLLATAERRTDAKGGQRQVVSLWDLEKPEPIHTFAGHQQPLGEVVFARDGKLLASSSLDGVVKIWDVEKIAGPAKPDDKASDDAAK